MEPTLIPLSMRGGPHIPDCPTETEIKRLLSFMEVQVLYFEQGPAKELTGVENAVHAHIPGHHVGTYDLIPVIGVGWIQEHNTAVVYIDEKAYAFAYAWVGGHESWLKREYIRERNEARARGDGAPDRDLGRLRR